jgi:hypothetical protein
MSIVYSIEIRKLKEAVGACSSYRQVLISLGINEYEMSYKDLKERISDLKLDVSHFTGKGWNKGKTFGFQRPIEDYLVNRTRNSKAIKITSHKLKSRLLIEGIFEHKCYKCLNTEWLGNKIPLELEHINGNRLDNRLKNLTLLCPNCHALTPTYRANNIGRYDNINMRERAGTGIQNGLKTRCPNGIEGSTPSAPIIIDL